jgi:hypothetical protein
LAVSEDVLPFRQFVLKVHSRCDLACDHCYVYEHAGQSWAGRPVVISPETVGKAGERIAEHARDNGLSGALLQGTYAHIGVTAYRRLRRHTGRVRGLR